MRFLLPLILLLSGCAHSADIHVTGKNVKTPYGEIEDGTIDVHTTWGKCNVTDNRSTNITK